jgi:hypothetical protein
MDPATIAALRAADAAISDPALEGVPPNAQAVAIAVAWARHLLSRGQA